MRTLTDRVSFLVVFHFQKFATNSLRKCAWFLFCFLQIFSFLSNGLFFIRLIWIGTNITQHFIMKYSISSGNLQSSCHFDLPIELSTVSLFSWDSKWFDGLERFNLFCFCLAFNRLKELKYPQLKREERFKHHETRRNQTIACVSSHFYSLWFVLLSIFCIPFGRSHFVHSSNEFNWPTVFHYNVSKFLGPTCNYNIASSVFVQNEMWKKQQQRKHT